MRSMCFTPLAVFFEINLALNFLFVFAGPIVNTLAFGALQFYQIRLRHISRVIVH